MICRWGHTDSHLVIWFLMHVGDPSPQNRHTTTLRSSPGGHLPGLLHHRPLGIIPKLVVLNGQFTFAFTTGSYGLKELRISHPNITWRSKEQLSVQLKVWGLSEENCGKKSSPLTQKRSSRVPCLFKEMLCAFIALHKLFQNRSLLCWRCSKTTDTHLPNSLKLRGLPTRVLNDLCTAWWLAPTLLQEECIAVVNISRARPSWESGLVGLKWHTKSHAGKKCN